MGFFRIPHRPESVSIEPDVEIPEALQGEQLLEPEPVYEFPDEVEEEDLSFIVAQFCSLYPGEFREGEIGWRFFWSLWHRAYSVRALHILSEIESQTVAEGLMSQNAAAPNAHRMYQHHANVFRPARS